jgi:hypothetical protein
LSDEKNKRRNVIPTDNIKNEARKIVGEDQDGRPCSCGTNNLNSIM